MKLKLGLIGHKRNILIIENIIKKFFQSFEIITIDFNNMKELPSIIEWIKDKENSLDAILFTGKIPFDIVNSSMLSSIPWVYIDNDQSQLLSVLLKANLMKNYDISKLSIDSYDEELINKIYENIGFSKDSIDIFVANPNIFDNKLIEYIKEFHINNYEKNNVSCCITNLSMVYEELVKRNIPSLIFEPTVDLVKNTIQHLELKMESKINEKSETVVISIEIDPRNEFSLINENEYQILLEKTKITQEIYLFAQKIQATVVEIGLNQYLLFCTKSILETETHNFNKLNLLYSVSKNTSSTISMGIGYGITVREAKFNAFSGMKKAFKLNGNKAFIVYTKNIIGPITSDNTTNKPSDEISIDKKYYKIADKSGISINTIFKLHCLIDESKKNSFTSKELARKLNITTRSMNRILKKLELNGYSRVIGKKVISNAGRPSRIIKLLF